MNFSSSWRLPMLLLVVAALTAFGLAGCNQNRGAGGTPAAKKAKGTGPSQAAADKAAAENVEESRVSCESFCDRRVECALNPGETVGSVRRTVQYKEFVSFCLGDCRAFEQEDLQCWFKQPCAFAKNASPETYCPRSPDPDGVLRSWLPKIKTGSLVWLTGELEEAIDYLFREVPLSDRYPDLRAALQNAPNEFERRAISRESESKYTAILASVRDAVLSGWYAAALPVRVGYDFEHGRWDLVVSDLGALASGHFGLPRVRSGSRAVTFRIPMEEEQARGLTGTFERIKQVQFMFAPTDSLYGERRISPSVARLCLEQDQSQKVAGSCSPWLTVREYMLGLNGESEVVLGSDWLSPSCQEFPACEQFGFCTAIEGECKAESDKDCNRGRRSPCKVSKRCRAAEGHCVADVQKPTE